MHLRRNPSTAVVIAAFLAASLICPYLGGVAHAQEARDTTAPQWVTPAVRAVRLQHRTFESVAARTKVSYHIYTPDVYDSEIERRFPVIYWLHGSGGRVPAAMVARLDSAIRAGKVPPVLVVFPNGLVNSLWVDSKDGRVPMETVVVRELLPHIDATFRTIDSPAGRLIEGMSMGGYGAARLGFKFPSLFGSVSILSGGPLQEEFKVHEAPRASPVHAQLVLDTVYGGDHDYFRMQSPWVLAEQNAEAVRRMRRIRQVVGDRDAVLENNRQFDARLSGLKIPHAFVVLPGVSHNLRELLTTLGEDNWAFYRDVFGRP
jgi:enterochelin esterase-like enzyme